MALNLKKAGKILDPKAYIDPVFTYSFAIAFRDRIAGVPKKKDRWLTGEQQATWEEGWDLMDELMRLREENVKLRARLVEPEEK